MLHLNLLALAMWANLMPRLTHSLALFASELDSLSFAGQLDGFANFASSVAGTTA